MRFPRFRLYWCSACKRFHKRVFWLLILLPFLIFFLMSQNTFAMEYGPAEFGLRYRDYNSSNYNWQLGLFAGPNYSVTGYGLNGVRIQWQNVVFQGNHASIHSEINIVSWEATNIRRNQWVNLPYQGVMACASNAGNVKVEQSNVSSVITNWTASNGSLRSTLTFYVDVALSGLNQNATGYIACLIGSNSYAFATVNNAQGVKYYVEQAPSRIEFSNNINDALLQTQINQNDTMIYNQNVIIDQNNQYYDANYDAVDNINNQQPNYPDSTNQQTTNLLGVLLNFLGIITNFGATSCLLNMPIPDFLGGAQLVNICQGRDLFGSFIGVIASMVALGFYLPLCLSLLHIIHNEIRSFTNG